MHFESARFEVPLQQIFKNVSAKISDVRVAVNRRSAGVHGDVRRVARSELLQRAGVSVKETESHHSTATLATAMALIPSPRPIAPNPSFVVALMLIASAFTPSAVAIFSCIAGMRGEIFGASASKVASSFTTRA